MTPVYGTNGKWLCACECGQIVMVGSEKLRRNQTKSCGCFRSERIVAMNKARVQKQKNRYGSRNKGTPEYNSWNAMKSRCLNPANPKFHLWGGRGISICPEWRASFAAFKRDMGPRPAGHTLDRIDNDGNYEPSNCRWASVATQRSNRRH